MTSAVQSAMSPRRRKMRWFWERPYWATKVWPIKAFRWIHDKRHWWIWVIYLLFTLLFSLSICNSVFQRRKIVELQDTQMKYRFIKASYQQTTTGTASWSYWVAALHPLSWWFQECVRTRWMCLAVEGGEAWGRASQVWVKRQTEYTPVGKCYHPCFHQGT